MRLDPADPRPVYRQVADDLRQQITSGSYRPGERLPSGRVLARKYGIAPMTVSSALNLLRDEGLIASWQGRGVYVIEPGRRAAAHPPGPERLTQVEADLEDLRRQVAVLRGQVTDLYARAGAPLTNPAAGDGGRAIPSS